MAINSSSSFLRTSIKRLLRILGFDPWARISWSQEGEDQILRQIFSSKPKGFYVDVGAHHPRRFSNTYLFYILGWSGINIDAMPGSMKLFDKERPRDINLEIGIGVNECELDYFSFNEPALNGFSKDLSNKRTESESVYQVKEVIKVNVLPLSLVLDRNLMPDQKIDFMSVDVEGLDLEVLKSNNWTKYKPQIVLVEVLDTCLHEIPQTSIGRFMAEVGYVIYAKSVNTVFFKAKDHK